MFQFAILVYKFLVLCHSLTRENTHDFDFKAVLAIAFFVEVDFPVPL